MRIVVFSTAFPPAHSHGGVPFSTFALVRELKRLGADVKVVSSDRNGSARLDVSTDVWTCFDGIPVLYYGTLPGPYLYGRRLKRLASEAVQGADLLVSSGTIWNHAGALADRLAKENHIPHVVYLRGLLDPWAWNHKSFRKKVFWHLQGRRILNNAACIVALTDAEKSAISTFGLRAPIEVIPNGVDAEDFTDFFSRDELEQKLPALSGKKILLFMGRISLQKGLDILIPAFDAITSKFPAVALVLCGPMLSSFEGRFRSLLRDCKSTGHILYLGVVDGSLKNSLLQHAACFVLPSYCEGLPMAVLEAMSLGKPVIVSEQCNLPEIARFNAGWVFSTKKESLERVLVGALGEGQELSHRGLEGKRLTEEIFSWQLVAKNTTRLFSTLLHSRASHDLKEVLA